MEPQGRLIMVEGVPFTGKSTASEYIAQQLALNGVETQWISEGMLFKRYFPRMSEVLSRREILSESLMWEEWNDFVQAIQADSRLFVVDSPLSYIAVYPLVADDHPTDYILAQCRRIADLLAPLRPRVIHLNGDTRYLVAASIAERGKGWEEQCIRQAEETPYQRARGCTGLEAPITLDHEAQVMMGKVLEDGGWTALRLPVPPADWAAHQRAILDFLGIPEVPIVRPTLPDTLLQSYIGTYTTDDPEAHPKLLNVQFNRDKLDLYSSDTWLGDLVPLSETRFHLRSSPVDFEFETENGVTSRLLFFNSEGKKRIYLPT
jgi:hypothetical protein